jgi:hypothetical protein
VNCDDLAPARFAAPCCLMIIETVTMMRDADGIWQAAGYYIK